MTAHCGTRQKIFIAVSIVFAMHVMPSESRAQSEAMSVEQTLSHLAWRAPPSCPSEGEVRDMAREHLRVPPSGPVLLHDAEVEVIAGEGGFVGTLRSGEVVRTFRSPSCLSVARAAAWVFATWVIEGAARPETEADPAGDEATAVEVTPTEDAPLDSSPTEDPPADTVPPADPTANPEVNSAPPAPEPEPEAAAVEGRAMLRLVTQLQLGFEAAAMPIVEPAIFPTVGIGFDWFEVDVGLLALYGLTSWGLGSDRTDRFFLVGGRVRVAGLIEISPQFELGAHLVSEVAWMGARAEGQADDTLYTTLGPGFEARFHPDPTLRPDIGIVFSLQIPIPLSRPRVELPLTGAAAESGTVVLMMGLGIVIRSH